MFYILIYVPQFALINKAVINVITKSSTTGDGRYR